jgi:dTDP-4-dehydrorhamnose reductase
MKRPLLLLGQNGQLGHELLGALQGLGPVLALDRAALNLCDLAAIRRVVRTLRPAVIVNAAAWTDVDGAEAQAELADQVNYRAPRVLAEEAARLDAVLVHYSTDYVFEGSGSVRRPTGYVESDPTGPLNVYGRTKLAGEQAIAAVAPRHLIFRTSWLYGRHGNNFLKTMMRLMREQDDIAVVADQIGAPTPAGLVASVTALALARVMHPVDGLRGTAAVAALPALPFGLYHLCASGQTSWAGYAQAVLGCLQRRRIADLRCTTIRAVSSAERVTVARRPADARLDCTRLQNALLMDFPDWETLLQLHFDDLDAADPGSGAD